MYQLSRMSHSDMIKVLKHLDGLVTDVYNIDMQILHHQAALSRYTKNVVNGKRRNGGILYFFMNILIPFAIIYGTLIGYDAITGEVDITSIIIEIVLIFLIILSFYLKKRANKKLVNNQFTQEVAESINILFQEREKAQKSCDDFCRDYSIPGIFKSSDAIRYVTSMLAQYHNISLKQAVDSYCASENANEARNARERQLKEIENIHRDIQKLHSEVRRGNIENELANNRRNNILTEFKYKN